MTHFYVSWSKNTVERGVVFYFVQYSTGIGGATVIVHLCVLGMSPSGTIFDFNDCPWPGKC